MSRLAEKFLDLPLADDLDAAVDAAIHAAGGDERTAIRAVILGQRNLMEAYAGVISAGYVRRGAGKRS
ncbi:hypothetical protein GCM10011390_03290 [Aureimonas endophytica]|uniref:Uncharacterized protein n=1 Tax=Aureimonas endophytica TaxID=2027858 RepID=A0A917DZI6_9HYPH|nr:hypothetical protein [Aureimonas endophytica]GGD87870.1 hypothetical protein GCM10011390_03290 [Aureimonas endophytica]